MSMCLCVCKWEAGREGPRWPRVFGGCIRSGRVGSGPVQIHLVYTSCKCIQDHKICLFCSLILHSSLTIVLIIIIIIVVICVSI